MARCLHRQAWAYCDALGPVLERRYQFRREPDPAPTAFGTLLEQESSAFGTTRRKFCTNLARISGVAIVGLAYIHIDEPIVYITILKGESHDQLVGLQAGAILKF